MDHYEPLNVIGSGSFGLIRKVRRKQDGKILVRKEIDYRRMSLNEKKQLVAEVNILRELRHPNIVRYYERFVDKDNFLIYIIMEYCEGGDLAAIIKRCKKEVKVIAEEIVWSIFAQLLLALNECHRCCSERKTVILHRDIKPENVLLDGRDTVKLGDFGLSRVLDNPELGFAKTFVGTPYYMSPEIVQESVYNTKSDIWALGCLVYEMCSLRPPFQANTQQELNLKIREGSIARLPKHYSDELYRVIRMMLHVNQDKRPSAADLLQHPHLKYTLARRDFDRRLKDVECRETVLKKAELELKTKEDILEARAQQLNEKELALKEQEKRMQQLQRSTPLQPKHLSMTPKERDVMIMPPPKGMPSSKAKPSVPNTPRMQIEPIGSPMVLSTPYVMNRKLTPTHPMSIESTPTRTGSRTPKLPIAFDAKFSRRTLAESPSLMAVDKENERDVDAVQTLFNRLRIHSNSNSPIVNKNKI